MILIFWKSSYATALVESTVSSWVLILLKFSNFFFRIHILKLTVFFYILAKTDKAVSFLLSNINYPKMTTFYQYIYFLELSMLWDVWPNDPILTPNYQTKRKFKKQCNKLIKVTLLSHVLRSKLVIFQSWTILGPFLKVVLTDIES